MATQTTGSEGVRRDIASVDAEALQAFAAGIRGGTVRAGDDGYDAARQVWNGMIDRRPGLVAMCAGAADVMDAVNFARANHLLTAIRGGGHNVAGFGTCDGGMVIDLSPMKTLAATHAALLGEAPNV